ncbi:MAG: polyprenyl synthetase family protein [Peptococcaceae bacterium]|nr:polyprenyl synthetase family protein [Peptococcaceae bacterium]
MSNSAIAAELLLVQGNIQQLFASLPLGCSAKVPKAPCLRPGKMLRPTVLLYAGLALGGGRERLVEAASAVEFLHSASLLHDDVIDNAHVRRGEPAAQGNYGSKNAVLWGDICFAAALRHASKLGDEGVHEVAEAVERMVRGELRQLAMQGNLALTVPACIEQQRAKTGALFSLAAKLGATVARAPYTMRSLAGEFGEHLGVVFQMKDDYLDYFGEAHILGKDLGRDMCEGVVTLPILLASQLAPHAGLMGRFAEGTLTVDHLPEVRGWIGDSGAIQSLGVLMRQQREFALAALRCWPHNEFRDALANCVEDLDLRC